MQSKKHCGEYRAVTKYHHHFVTAHDEMIRKVVKDEAKKIIRDYGADAYKAASKRLGAARRLRRARLGEFLEQVAREVERHMTKGRPN